MNASTIDHFLSPRSPSALGQISNRPYGVSWPAKRLSSATSWKRPHCTDRSGRTGAAQQPLGQSYWFPELHSNHRDHQNRRSAEQAFHRTTSEDRSNHLSGSPDRVTVYPSIKRLRAARDQRPSAARVATVATERPPMTATPQWRRFFRYTGPACYRIIPASCIDSSSTAEPLRCSCGVGGFGCLRTLQPVLLRKADEQKAFATPHRIAMMVPIKPSDSRSSQ